MYFRNLIWTMDFRNRLWSNHPTEMIVRPDYVILYWEAIPGFSQGVKPTSVVITHQCRGADGSKIFTFTILDKNTTRRGSPNNRRTVRRPRKVSSTARVIKYLPSADSDNDGEFHYIPKGESELTAICGSGLFWHYFRWWITPVDNTIMQGYAKYLPQLYGISFPNTIHGDHTLCRIDKHFECVDVCLIDTTEGQVKTRFGFGDNLVIRKTLPPISNKVELADSRLSTTDPNLFFQTIETQLTAFYGPHELRISPAIGTEIQSSVFITVVGNAEFTWYDVNGNETNNVSQICSYHYDHTPIFRVDAYNCVQGEPPSECDGLAPGWHLRVCIEWVDPVTNDENSLCQIFFLFPPLGLPFEGADWMLQLANYLLQIVVDKVNSLIASLLNGIVLSIPPQYRIIGKFIILIYDLYQIRVGAYFFYCPPDPESPDPAVPVCGPGTYLIMAQPL